MQTELTRVGEPTAEPSNRIENDALSLEYKLENRRACGYLDLSDIVNNPVGLGVVWISGYGLEKHLLGLLGSDLRALSDDVSDSLLISLERGQPLT